MCFVRGTIVHKIAKQDITCFKIMKREDEDMVNSWHFPRSTPYKEGDFIIPYYSRTPKEIDTCKYLEGTVVHAYADVPSGYLLGAYLSSGRYAVIVKCTIPKGTAYWANSYNHDIVATRIRIDEIAYLPTEY